MLCLLAVAQSFAQSGAITVLARDGRRSLATVELQNHAMVALDDLAAMFQLQIREDQAARAVTATYQAQTIVLTPDQSLVSASGRLVSLPAPFTRRGNRWFVPIEFISRALAPIYDVRLDLRPASRLLVLGDLRVPRVTAQYDEGPNALRVTFDITPRATTSVTQEQNRLLVRIDADALDASLAAPASASAHSLLTALRVSDTTIQMDLGPRFSTFRTSPPVSRGAAAVITVELTAAPAAVPDATAAPPVGAPGSPAAPAGTPDSPAALPVFGVATRPTIRTVMLDPGHGGDDSGVKGAGGTLEKDVTLAIARRVKHAVETRLGMRVLLTREDDRRLGADTRAAIANNNKADVFIALHANGSPRPTTRGAEIFTLSLDRFGEEARRQSQSREVLPVFGGGAREFLLVDWELAQAAHLDESNILSSIVEQKLRATAMPSVTLQRGPMRALTGTNMPAVLIEVGYLSNTEDEQLIKSGEFQNAVAIALADAISAFRDQIEKAPAPAPTP